MLFCPECKNYCKDIISLEKTNYKPTVINMRDGWGRPIRHYLCDCGNPLAGVINTTGEPEDSDDYYKNLIIDYNVGGIFFEDGLLENAKRILSSKDCQRGDAVDN